MYLLAGKGKESLGNSRRLVTHVIRRKMSRRKEELICTYAPKLSVISNNEGRRTQLAGNKTTSENQMTTTF